MTSYEFKIPKSLITVEVDTDPGPPPDWTDTFTVQAKIGDHVIYERAYTDDTMLQNQGRFAADEEDAVERFQYDIAQRLKAVLSD